MVAHEGTASGSPTPQTIVAARTCTTVEGLHEQRFACDNNGIVGVVRIIGIIRIVWIIGRRIRFYAAFIVFIVEGHILLAAPDILLQSGIVDKGVAVALM